MFSHQFDPSLENISLSRNIIPTEAETVEGADDLTTLGEAVRSFNYLLFYVVSSSTLPNQNFVQSLSKLIASKNQSVETKSPHRTSSPAKLKRLFKFSKNHTKKAETAAAPSSEVAVVVVDIENNPNEANLSFVWELGMFYARPQHYTTKSRLLRSLNFISAPSLFLLDCANLVVLSQAYRTLMDDPSGIHFPWPNVPASELFQGELLQNSNTDAGTTLAAASTTIRFADLEKGVKGIFFGAKWCPPSKQLLQQLSEIYPKIKVDHPPFEIIFCSSDRSEKSFQEHFSSMPWLAIPFGSEKLGQIAKAYDICGIPSFILVDEDYSLISRNGRNVLLSDPHGYPWKRKALYELTEHSVHRISEMPSLILFTEGSSEDTEFSIQILSPFAEWISQLSNSEKVADQSNKSEDVLSKISEKGVSVVADPFQIFYTGEDPICDHILESLGQEQAELPLLLICDSLAGHFVVCDKPNVSESVVFEFVTEYRNGQCNVLPIPAGSKQTQNRTVGGIPVQLLEPFISSRSQQQQPQQLEFAKSA